MLKKTAIATLFCLAAVSAQAQAQGVIGGAREGAHEGGRDAGPVGAVIGGAAGAAVGGVKGLLGVNDRPRFKAYVVAQHRPSYHYDGDVVVGAALPPSDATFYDVPEDYGVTTYRYAVIDGHIVLVDPGTRRIVQIID